MSEKTQTSNSTTMPAKASDHRNLHAWILWIVGIILVIAGIAVVTVKGTHLRGSGLGTALLILGFILVIIGVVRYMYKRPR
jgi:uncharacterized membrane protein HdeD (DUF308 family)